jgi:hypothetical protein
MVVRQIRVSNIPKWNTGVHLSNPISAIKKKRRKVLKYQMVIKSDKSKNDKQFNDK